MFESRWPGLANVTVFDSFAAVATTMNGPSMWAGPFICSPSPWEIVMRPPPPCEMS